MDYFEARGWFFHGTGRTIRERDFLFSFNFEYLMECRMIVSSDACRIKLTKKVWIQCYVDNFYEMNEF